MSADTLDQVARQLLRDGRTETSDRYRVCLTAIGYFGMPYQQNEELSRASIDCSTLTSQSHWEGALLTIPFIAEGQRVGRTGRSVSSPSVALPGDIVVRYSSIADSPDGRFNHVGMFLGPDGSGNSWIIEARGGKHVMLTKVGDFPAEGGIRRYLQDDDVSFNSRGARRALELAPLVPKLGRPGARQYTRNSDARLPHRGADIYVQPGTRVYAPLGGSATRCFCSLEEAPGVTIDSPKWGGAIARLLHVELQIPGERCEVEAGELIGVVIPPRGQKLEYVAGMSSESTHLHFELAIDDGALGFTEPYLDAEGHKFYNPLLVLKHGECEAPIIAPLRK